MLLNLGLNEPLTIKILYSSQKTRGSLLTKKETFMPNKNGLGPNGEGARTGRGLGNCEGSSTTNENAEATTDTSAVRSYGMRDGNGRKHRGGFGRNQNQRKAT